MHTAKNVTHNVSVFHGGLGFVKYRAARSFFSLFASAILCWLCAGNPSVEGFEDLAQGVGVTGHAGTQLHPSDEELAAWIKQLGAKEFQVREDAVSRLLQCDVKILDRIRTAASESSDPEVRGRCQEIAAAIYEIYLGDRCREFLRGEGDEAEAGFSAWKAFSGIAGTGRLSRRMFVEFAKDYPELADSELSEVEFLIATTDRISDQIWERFQKNEMIRVSDALAMQLCSVQLQKMGGELKTRTQGIATMLVRTAPYASLLNQSAYQITLRKITGAWMTSTTMPVENLLPLALEAGISDIIVRVREILAREDVSPVVFEMAMACMVRFGSTEDLTLVSKWCEVETVHSQHEYERIQTWSVPREDDGNLRFNPPFEFSPPRMVEIRYQDIAIASWMKLAGKTDLREYFPGYREHPLRVFLIPSLGFTEEESALRQKAVDAWREQAQAGGQSESPALSR